MPYNETGAIFLHCGHTPRLSEATSAKACKRSQILKLLRETQLRICHLTLGVLHKKCHAHFHKKIFLKWGRSRRKLHGKGKASKPHGSGAVNHWWRWRGGCWWQGRQRAGVPAASLMSLSFRSNWQGEEGSRFLPLKVCAGVKGMVFHHFLHCLVYDYPLIDGSCFDGADDIDIDLSWTGLTTARRPQCEAPRSVFIQS